MGIKKQNNVWNLSTQGETISSANCRLIDSLVGLIQSVFLPTAISNEMKRVQLKIQEEKEKEKKIYAKMFAWTFQLTMQWILLNNFYQYLKSSLYEKLYLLR